MKYVSVRLWVVVALMLTTLFALSTNARRVETTASGDERIFKRLTDEQKPDGFEMQVRNNEIIGVTVVRKGGSRMALKQQSNPAGGASCPSGRPQVCWEDEAQQMTICTCEPRASTHFRLIL